MFSPFDPFRWALAHGRHLDLGPRGVLMAIINVTPDSFSDGGRFDSADRAVARAILCLEEGAQIVAGQRGDRGRHFLHVLVGLARGDDDFLQRRVRGGQWQGGQQRRGEGERDAVTQRAWCAAVGHGIAHDVHLLLSNRVLSGQPGREAVTAM